MDIQTTTSIERLSKQLYALTEVSKTLSLPCELPELLDRVLQCIVGVLEPADVGVVMLWDQSSGLFRPVAAFGYNLVYLKQLGLRPGESVTGKAFDSGKAVLLDNPESVANAKDDLRHANRINYLRALGQDQLPFCSLATPISVGDQKFGVLILESLRQTHQFCSQDVPFVQSLADLIGLAIDRARLQIKADVIREAREAEQLRSEVMAMLSHELRLPLTSIKGYSTALLLDDLHWDAKKKKEFLQLIDEECDTMQVMIKDILDSSLIDVNQLNLEPEPIRLQHIARQVIDDVQRRVEQHHIVTDIPSDFPIVLADPRWIRQVFRNILDNAIKYSPEGGLIVIRGEVRTTDVVISVADQGIGISPEDLIPLFEKFFRVKSAIQYHVPGTGLGLPIARTVIEAHGGRIWVESQLGHGTIVFFSLPKSPRIPDDEL